MTKVTIKLNKAKKSELDCPSAGPHPNITWMRKHYCGDPYCGSCGSPAEAEFADLLDEMVEEISDGNFTIDELRTFISIGKQAVKLHRGMLNLHDVVQDLQSLQDGKSLWKNRTEKKT